MPGALARTGSKARRHPAPAEPRTNTAQDRGDSSDVVLKGLRLIAEVPADTYLRPWRASIRRRMLRRRIEAWRRRTG
jgi:hypothetical protein